jgi:peptidoglycan/xylan/chitin deacetylase (PgdA/CDA1 family)
MSSKKCLITFFASILLVFVLYGGFNAAIDPFGVFGDRILSWYSYNETMNPRAAKIAYLDRHYREYDSYIIGCSSTSGFPVADLNKYYNAKFYNMIMYGADMKDVELTVAYMLKNYTVKNLVLNVYIDNGITYDTGEDTLTHNLSPQVSGSSVWEFYKQYLFLNPQYALAKLDALKNDAYLAKPFDVFDVQTGAYDKRLRDTEYIGGMEDYLKSYPVFKAYPKGLYSITRTAECMASVTAIRDMCSAAGVELAVVSAPVYRAYLDYFAPAEVTDFFTQLANITPFWDFTMSSVSCEPRYFYDGTHFRNAVGTMALARIFGDKSVYVPDFGVLVTPRNAARHLATYWDGKVPDVNRYTADVPVLMYHQVDAMGEATEGTSVGTFKAHLEALKQNGYTTISIEELIAYVKRGAPLPEKPVLLTFDDGYLSNYELVYPLLKEYGMKATFFVIGSSVGRSTYKDTAQPITPHFSDEQAKEMSDSGLVSIQSHTYDMHQSVTYETGRARESILPFDGEDEETYITALRQDFLTAKAQIEAATGKPVSAMAYPYGKYETLTQALLWEMGVEVTFTTKGETSTVIKGLPQSLLGMGRYNVSGGVSVDTLLRMVASARG